MIGGLKMKSILKNIEYNGFFTIHANSSKQVIERILKVIDRNTKR